MSDLVIEYGGHERVREVVDRLTYCAEGISVSFDGYEEPHVKGPGLYFAVIDDSDYGAYADRWGTTAGRATTARPSSTRTRSRPPPSPYR